MNRATPPMRNVAKRLIAYESEGSISAGIQTGAAFHATEKLGSHLTTLMGNSGFRALLARAHALAKTEVPWLRDLRVEEDGAIAGLEEARARLDPEEFLEGRVVLLAQFVGLLVVFIGERFTVRLLREAWPKVSLGDLDFGNGGNK